MPLPIIGAASLGATALSAGIPAAISILADVFVGMGLAKEEATKKASEEVIRRTKSVQGDFNLSTLDPYQTSPSPNNNGNSSDSFNTTQWVPNKPYSQSDDEPYGISMKDKKMYSIKDLEAAGISVPQSSTEKIKSRVEAKTKKKDKEKTVNSKVYKGLYDTLVESGLSKNSMSDYKRQAKTMWIAMGGKGEYKGTAEQNTAILDYYNKMTQPIASNTWGGNRRADR